MKLFTWNCQGAFRKKYMPVANMKPDLAVIQECELPERLNWAQGSAPTQLLWFGDKPNKGLGVFSWTNLEFHALEGYDRSIRHCIPLEISAPYRFQFIAIWAMDETNDKLSYSAQVYQAVSVYRDFIQSSDTVLMGDFNSNPRSSTQGRVGNHTALSFALDQLWLISAYHQHFHERPGQEKQATYYFSRKIERPAHIDYAYIPVRWLRRLKKVQVGDPKLWLEHSDHCPLTVEITPLENNKIV